MDKKIFEISRATSAGKSFFSFNTDEFDPEYTYIMIAFEFENDFLVKNHYVWETKPIEEIKPSATSKKDLIKYLIDNKTNQPFLNIVNFDNRKSSPLEILDKLSKLDDGSSSLNYSVTDLTQMIIDKNVIGYIGNASKFYCFDLYVLKIEDSASGIVIKKSFMMYSIFKDVQLYSKRTDAIPYYKNGEPVLNYKFKDILDQIKEEASAI